MAEVTPKAPSKKRAKRGEPGSMPKSVEKLPTKAAKIRTLWLAGWTRSQIANVLGIAFQHVYNTTKRPTKDYKPK